MVSDGANGGPPRTLELPRALADGTVYTASVVHGGSLGFTTRRLRGPTQFYWDRRTTRAVAPAALAAAAGGSHPQKKILRGTQCKGDNRHLDTSAPIARRRGRQPPQALPVPLPKFSCTRTSSTSTPPIGGFVCVRFLSVGLGAAMKLRSQKQRRARYNNESGYQ